MFPLVDSDSLQRDDEHEDTDEVITEGEEDGTNADDSVGEESDEDSADEYGHRPQGFPSPFNFINRAPYTLVELRMRLFSGKIRSKPTWWEKVYEPSIVAKWREEMIEQDSIVVYKLWGGEQRYTLGVNQQPKKWPRSRISTAQLDYIFEQLRYEGSQRDPEAGIFATSIYSIHESRSLVPSELKDELLKGTALLEDVPDDEKDWHPGSNKQVLNLVHPSLYCLRIGQSRARITDDDDSLEVLTWESYLSQERRPDIAEFMKSWNNNMRYVISEKYQWLPTDFQVSSMGDVHPLAYINNLHPTRHGSLYRSISSVLSKFIPLFERVLSDVRSPEPRAIKVDPYMWYNHEPEPPDWPWEKQEYQTWERKHHWPRFPKPAPFTPPDATKRVEYSLKNRKIQVIVKLANIVLTPEDPTYAGGAWHVEGMANENIVATGLYYYACENITESRLDFRVTVGTYNGYRMPHQQDDHRGYVVMYGFGRDDQQNQNIGHIVAEENKCIAFPNIYQHHVDGFQLADPTKPGHRKILCFFLVNPETEILSTTNVPPQQEDWLKEEVEKVPAMQRLPVELFDMIMSYVKQDIISREKAEEHRAELMKERSNFIIEHNEKVYEIPFNMCEH